MDFISGSYDPGDLYLFRGLGDGKYAAVEKILDKAGVPLVHHPVELSKFMKVTDRKEQARNENITLRVASFGSWPAMVDWDDDGDLDMLVGSFSGQLFLRVNEGTRSEPEFSSESLPVKVGDKQLAVNMHCNPVVADWDGDGLWDLIVGAGDGSVCWFKNTGKPGQASFAKSQLLIPAKSKNKFLMQNLEEDEAPQRGTRSQICVADFNLDGKLDLLVGDHSNIKRARDLSEEEQGDFERLRLQQTKVGSKLIAAQRKMSQTQQAMNAAEKQLAKADIEQNDKQQGESVVRSDEQIEYDKAVKAHKEVELEYREASSEYSKLSAKEKEFYLENRDASFLWLFLRQDDVADSTSSEASR